MLAAFLTVPDPLSGIEKVLRDRAGGSGGDLTSSDG